MEEKIEKILKNINVGILEYNGDNMYADGILDSLDFVEVIEELENDFDIEFEPEEILLENFGNMHAIKKMVQKHLENN